MESSRYRERLLAGAFQGRDLLYISVDVRLAFHAFQRHPPDLAKDRTLRPGTVVQPETPENIGVSVRIPAIQRISIVDIHHGPQCIFASWRPFDDLLAPI